MSTYTINKDGTPRKKGSGRTKGANSFVHMSLNDLKKYVSEDVKVPISRVWLRNLGFNDKK